MEVLKLSDPTLTFDSIIKKLTDSDGLYKTQRQLSSLGANAKRESIVDKFNEKEKVIINSFCDVDCGRWFKMAPKSDWLNLTNSEFMSAIRFRLVLSQEKIIDGTPCTCNRRHNVDKLGVHFSTGCSVGGWRIRMHDMVVQILQAMCSYSGFSSKIEPVGMFRGNDNGLAEEIWLLIIWVRNRF